VSAPDFISSCHRLCSDQKQLDSEQLVVSAYTLELNDHVTAFVCCAAEKALIASGEMSTWVPRTFGGDRIIMPPEILNITLYLWLNSTAVNSSFGSTPGALMRPLPPAATQVSQQLASADFPRCGLQSGLAHDDIGRNTVLKLHWHMVPQPIIRVRVQGVHMCILLYRIPRATGGCVLILATTWWHATSVRAHPCAASHITTSSSGALQLMLCDAAPQCWSA
jgi:hypothetical protein